MVRATLVNKYASSCLDSPLYAERVSTSKIVQRAMKSCRVVVNNEPIEMWKEAVVYCRISSYSYPLLFSDRPLCELSGRFHLGAFASRRANVSLTKRFCLSNWENSRMRKEDKRVWRKRAIFKFCLVTRLVLGLASACWIPGIDHFKGISTVRLDLLMWKKEAEKRRKKESADRHTLPTYKHMRPYHSNRLSVKTTSFRRNPFGSELQFMAVASF